MVISLFHGLIDIVTDIRIVHHIKSFFQGLVIWYWQSDWNCDWYYDYIILSGTGYLVLTISLTVVWYIMIISLFQGLVIWYWWCQWQCILHHDHFFVSGTGYLVLTMSLTVVWYVMIILAWIIYYFYNSFKSPLPWSTCYNKWNTPNCQSKIDFVAVSRLLYYYCCYYESL